MSTSFTSSQFTSSSTSNHNSFETPIQVNPSKFKAINPDSAQFSHNNMHLKTALKGHYKDPMLLSPCGHTFGSFRLVKSLSETKVKKCPDCSRVYTFAVENLFVKKFTDSINIHLYQNHNLSTAIQGEMEKLPETEKKQIDEIFASFLKTGEPENIKEQLSKMIISTAEHRILMPVYKLFLEYCDFYETLSKEPQTPARPAQASAPFPPSTPAISSLPHIHTSLTPPGRSPAHTNIHSTTPSIPLHFPRTPLLSSIPPQFSPSSAPIIPASTNSIPVQLLPHPTQFPTSAPSSSSDVTEHSNSSTLQPWIHPTGSKTTVQTTSSTHSTTPLANPTPELRIKFLNVVQLADIICPLTKQFLKNAYQLVPCGHNFNKEGILDAFSQKNSKTCNVCVKPYTSIIPNLFLQTASISYLKHISKPGNDVTAAIENLLKSLSQNERDNQSLQTTLKNFMSGNPFPKDVITELALNSSHSDIYISLLTLIEEHQQNAHDDLELLIKDTLEASTATPAIHNSSGLFSNELLLPSSSSSSTSTEVPPNLNMEVDTSSETVDASPSVPASTQEPDALPQRPRLKFKRPLSQPKEPEKKSRRIIYIDTEEENPEQPTFAPSSDQTPASTSDDFFPSSSSSTPSSSSFSNLTTTTSTTTDPNTSISSPAEQTSGERPLNETDGLQHEDNYMETESFDEADMSLINELDLKHKNDSSALVNRNSVKAVDKKGNTPLHLIVKKFNDITPIFHELFKFNIDVNAQNAKGQTPLHIAARLDKVKLIPLLLEHGASLEIYDNQGRRPQDLSLKKGTMKALKS